MIRNYIQVALRNLFKNKIYTAINIAGLALGLSSFIMIVLYIKSEVGYDTFYKQSDNIYRINTHVDVNGMSNSYPMAHYPAAFDMQKDYPEVANATNLYPIFYLSNERPRIRYEEKEFEEDKLYLADSGFFSVFDFDFKYGNAANAFENSYSVVLTQATSKKYFGDVDPTGRLIQLQDSITLKVTGVLKPFRGKTHLEFDFLVNAKLLQDQLVGFKIDNAYVGTWYYSFIVLEPETRVNAFQDKLAHFVKKYYPPRYTENNANLTIQSIKDIHLYSHFSRGDMSVNGDINYIYTLGSIAILILLIACINFMNLSIARFSSRGKEIGIRKVMGAEKYNLIFQFLGESVVVSTLAGIFSIGLVRFAMPAFNRLATAKVLPNDLWDPVSLVFITLIMVLTGVLAGLYPAFVMSSFNPVLILKGVHKSSHRKIDLRKVLVVVQFVVSLILLIGALVISDQLDFMRSKDLGFDKSKIITIPVGGTTMPRDYNIFKNRLKQISGVAEVTNLSHDLAQHTLPYFPMRVEGKEDEQMLPIMYVGFDFLETFNIPLLSGRSLDIRYPNDSTGSFVINESAAKALNWSDPIGRKVSLGVGGDSTSRVVGVVKDFNFDPVKNAIGPLVIGFSSARDVVALKISTQKFNETVSSIEDIWKELIPSRPFAFAFLEDSLHKTYVEEEKLFQVFSYFCGLAIFVAALGLFALASFSMERRKREIGIRKVLGASESGLIFLLFKEYLFLIGASFILASPLAYYLFNQWLNGFAYRVDIELMTFLVALWLITLVSLLTVGYHSFSATRTNPINVLRNN